MISQWFKSLHRVAGRRQTRQRIARYFECAWLSTWGPQLARISSLSPTGCYIEHRFVPAEGDPIPELTVALPSGHICVQGTVLGAMPGVGFAVRFKNIDPRTSAQLRDVVNYHRRQQRAI